MLDVIVGHVDLGTKEAVHQKVANDLCSSC